MKDVHYTYRAFANSSNSGFSLFLPLHFVNGLFSDFSPFIELIFIICCFYERPSRKYPLGEEGKVRWRRKIDVIWVRKKLFSQFSYQSKIMSKVSRIFFLLFLGRILNNSTRLCSPPFCVYIIYANRVRLIKLNQRLLMRTLNVLKYPQSNY